MSDIVERLRCDGVRDSYGCVTLKQRLLIEAADEIERLRADNHKLMLWNEELQADLDRARRALEGK